MEVENYMFANKRKAIDRIDEKLPIDLKILVKQYILTKSEHLEIFEKIKEISYLNKVSVEKPSFNLVLGQTGSGKTNLTQMLLKDKNIVAIDADIYKGCRKDCDEILKKYPTLFSYLTGPDSYAHRDELILDAMNKKYNILIDYAPKFEEGTFIDFNILEEKGYCLNIYVMGVSKLNCLLSIHERYEEWIRSGKKNAKLTTIKRYDESYEVLFNMIRRFQKIPNVLVEVYKRGKDRYSEPELVYSNTKENLNFSCAQDAVEYLQEKDNQETLLKFESRYNKIINLMIERNAPKEQMEQLEKVKNIFLNYS